MTEHDRKARKRDWIVVAFLALLLVVAAVAAISALTAIHASRQTARVVRSNTRASVALCALRLDLERRVDGSIKFLTEHPHGFSGISARAIQAGIDNQERTIVALKVLRCPPLKPPKP
jgi:type II secretory pathway pseudopilin PulG